MRTRGAPRLVREGSARTKRLGRGVMRAMRTMSESLAMMAWVSPGATSAQGRSSRDTIFTSPSPCAHAALHAQRWQGKHISSGEGRLTRMPPRLAWQHALTL